MYEELIATLALCAQLAVPINAPVNEPVYEPVKLVAEIEVIPVMVVDKAKLSLDSTDMLEPARSVNKLAYVICLLPDVASPGSSFIKNLSVDIMLILAVVGNVGVAVTPVNPPPFPVNEPLNEPVKLELAPVNWIDVLPIMVVPLSVRLELAKAFPVHLVMLLVVKADAPLTATVWADAPLYENVVMPVPWVNELPTDPAPGAYDALTAYELDKAYDALVACELDKAYEALKAYELDKA